MRFNNLPKDLQDKVLELAPKYPLTLDEVTKLYLMGEDHADYLCQLKTMNVSDIFILLANQELWNEKNKKIWNELNSL